MNSPDGGETDEIYAADSSVDESVRCACCPSRGKGSNPVYANVSGGEEGREMWRYSSEIDVDEWSSPDETMHDSDRRGLLPLGCGRCRNVSRCELQRHGVASCHRKSSQTEDCRCCCDGLMKMNDIDVKGVNCHGLVNAASQSSSLLLRRRSIRRQNGPYPHSCVKNVSRGTAKLGERSYRGKKIEKGTDKSHQSVGSDAIIKRATVIGNGVL